MNALASGPRILLIDSNVYFSKRVGDALRQLGFEVVQCTQVSYALTMLEWNAPSAVLCATNLREMGALEMAPILRADPKTTNIALIAIGGGGSDQALLEAYRAGCDDFVDRRKPPSDIAAHVRNFLISRQEGFQPTQMLLSADTDLSGSLSHLDLAGVIQMLGPARQTGALHINATDADGIIFFEAGEIVHAECDALFGDEAVKEIIQTCQGAEKGVYKFVYGATAAQRTVLRSATDLLLDAMRELDEEQNANQEQDQHAGQHAEQHDGQHEGLHENAEKEWS
jgi:CheY-like chemotaxis protein